MRTAPVSLPPHRVRDQGRNERDEWASSTRSPGGPRRPPATSRTTRHFDAKGAGRSARATPRRRWRAPRNAPTRRRRRSRASSATPRRAGRVRRPGSGRGAGHVRGESMTEHEETGTAPPPREEPDHEDEPAREPSEQLPGGPPPGPPPARGGAEQGGED